MGSQPLVPGPNTKMATALRLILLLLLALSYKFERKEDLIKEKLALQKHISNSIDHGPTYKSNVKDLHHSSGNYRGLLGHRGEHHDIRTKKKQKQKFGHRGEHHQSANTRYDNDDITLQKLDNHEEAITKKIKKLRIPKTLKKQLSKKEFQKKKMYKKLYKQKSKKTHKYKKHV